LSGNKGERKMGYYTITDGGPDEGHYEDFHDALDAAMDLAGRMAADQGLDEEAIDTFENGDRSDPASKSWEAGACPDGNDGAYWPHVEWRND
jgi:hypothetical protein